jgi:hypothetical protein
MATKATKNGNGNKATVADLLKQLAASTDQDEKRVIRRQLRARGHTGGLRKPKPHKKAVKKAAPKPNTQKD